MCGCVSVDAVPPGPCDYPCDGAVERRCVHHRSVAGSTGAVRELEAFLTNTALQRTYQKTTHVQASARLSSLTTCT